MEKLYTNYMKQFVISIFPPSIFVNRTSYLSLALAAWVTFVTVTQLFAFENFPAVISAYASGGVGGKLYAVLIVLVEIASLPFLLHMDLSRVARSFSAFFTVLVPFLWLGLSIFLWGTPHNVGLFGAMVDVSAQITVVLCAIWAMATACLVWRLRTNRTIKS